ncbi:RanGTP-binding protein [Rasamsonia emersonii CBS 393.64]|uniref:RanGTP-binding protein n=1 Tax=Rasamsonia emersonii (strain ATCC 16479 / CBS 393.64 / IMI 116815) TaxID=1408163 RepID=A0A0F4Z1P9_RASE3|nr:RanGTP-binding protein [Rasamsonia emersonii CBS 393.64]KKA24275.1 RanGTP-binding protein [Rasamsonia emersonii CBS 393.64]
MEAFLSKVTQQAMNYAIRSGITITASYVIRQSSRLLKVISPAIDMIELIYDIQSLARRLDKAATTEELARKGAISAKARAQNDEEIKRIIQDIKNVLDRIEDAVPLMNLAITTSGASLSTSLPSTVSPSRLLQASTFLTACDTQYSITPSRAVQVGPTFTLSMYMLFTSHMRPHDEESIRETTWKEVMHKARVKLRRVPMDVFFGPEQGKRKRSRLPAEARADEFAYQILIVEDLDDGRVHTFDEKGPQPESYEGVSLAGMREIIPVHQVSKIFYADTGKMLNIGSEAETNSPVLLLKRDVNAIPPRRMVERDETEYEDFERDSAEEEEEEEEEDDLQSQLDAQLNGDVSLSNERSYYESLSERQIPEAWRLPPGLDPEWLAFEVYQEEDEDESESETEPPSPPRQASRESSVDPQLIANLSIDSNATPSKSSPSRRDNQVSMASASGPQDLTSTVSNPLFSNIRTSLSLLEMLLRLTSLQQFQQQSHLSITDELLNFFLEESSSTGAGGDEQHRQRLRAEARRKVGWDPYDESPLKPRGEDYQYRHGEDWIRESTPDRYYYAGGDGYTPLPPEGRLPPGEGYQIRSREQTPESPGLPRGKLSSPGGGASRRPPPPGAGAAAGRRYHPGPSFSNAEAAIRRGSPLSRRPTTAETDEGLGTSPGSLHTAANTTANTPEHAEKSADSAAVDSKAETNK